MTEGRETSQSLPFHSRPPRSHHAFVACLEGAGSRHTYLLYVSRRSLFIYPRPVQRCADTLLYSALLCSISGCASAVAGWLLVGCCTKACFGGGLGGNTIERGDLVLLEPRPALDLSERALGTWPRWVCIVCRAFCPTVGGGSSIGCAIGRLDSGGPPLISSRCLAEWMDTLPGRSALS